MNHIEKAYQEAIASCDHEVVISHTIELEINENIYRFVNGYKPITVSIDEVDTTFDPISFDIAAYQVDEKSIPQLKIKCVNLAGLLFASLLETLTNSVVYVTYRPFDASGNLMATPMKLYVVDISGSIDLTITCRWHDLHNESYPKQRYTREYYPGVWNS